jgi:ABC-2 type transport system ATP-binding protein
MIAKMKDIVKRYGDTLVLDHLNLDIKEGEILGLLGPNGAGKTTTIRILSGLINADSGNTTVFDSLQNVKNLEVRR